MKNIFKLVISILVCQLAGVVGSIFTINSVSGWYLELVKPSFNPPSWIFSPVWITLFLLMGISLYLVWIKKAKIAMVFFGIQLFFNILWSVLFFGLKSPLLAFIDIIILWIFIFITIIKFYKVSRISVYLLLPYILWVSFAAVLNFFIFILN